MTVFDPEALKRTLLEAGVPIDDVTIERVSDRLDRLWREHQDRKLRYGSGLAKTSQELINLYNALAEWLRSKSGECIFEQTMLDRYGGGENLKSAYRLVVTIQDVIDQRESEWRARRGEDLTTTLMLEIYYLYIELTGKDGLSDGGPVYRFVSRCITQQYAPDFVVKKVGFADLLRKADARRKKRDKILNG